MKRKNEVKYREEPKGDGWEFDGARRLTDKEIAAAGIPSPAELAGAEYERSERDGVVTLKARRGGRREGAGRKATGHVRMQLLVSPATRRKIEAWAKRRRITLSEAVDQMAARA